jgi:hypothetical protein
MDLLVLPLLPHCETECIFSGRVCLSYVCMFVGRTKVRGAGACMCARGLA